jgi:hypothetical protein
MTEYGEKVIRELYEARVQYKDGLHIIKTRNGDMQESCKEQLFWNWLSFVKSL